ncbi:hypothetical protein FBEOM_5110 [Fusarium beomiforme]|uniref:DUF6546 domain-containing protein n=1 Tax=Fusarium beomiforme TaxID=44412 RepID=A0A9P5DXG4_9HYPO|nr:hypothetical protein FBEOM_5110 [Fusarium beomiforme]
MSSFHSLPAEIQGMIFDIIHKDEWRTGQYAAVNRCWQDYFERKNFKSLEISRLEVQNLKRIVTPRRQVFVKHIWYRILLDKYIYDMTKVEEKPKVLWEADSRFTQSIQSMWGVLKDWDARNSLTFELTAYSPVSDWSDLIDRRENTWEKDFAAYRLHKKSGSKEPYSYPDDPLKLYVEKDKEFISPSFRRYWWALRRNLMGWKSLEFTSKQSYNEEVYFIRDPIVLPTVSVISKFLIRRTNFRQFCPDALSQIFDSLRNIQDITIERWVSMVADDETAWCRKARRTFAEDLPMTVKTLSLSGNRCPIFHSWPSSRVRRRKCLAKILRRHSKSLENLHLSDIIEAEDFLSLSQESLFQVPRWKELEALILTTEAFVYNTSDRSSMESLLCAAARAARRMPRLKELEIRSSRSNECFFRFEIVDTIANLTWSGPVLDSSQIMRDWQRTSAWRDTADIRTTGFDI